jgi:hypothetical protein
MKKSVVTTINGPRYEDDEVEATVVELAGVEIDMDPIIHPSKSVMNCVAPAS